MESKYDDSDICRFENSITKTSTCWNWSGSIKNNGYGVFWLKGKLLHAHRISYELHNGTIQKNLQIDHVCHNRKCVNPEHLEQVTQKENILRGEGFAAINAKKTHCPKGHSYTGNNLYVNPKGERKCKKCNAIAQQVRRDHIVRI